MWKNTKNQANFNRKSFLIWSNKISSSNEIIYIRYFRIMINFFNILSLTLKQLYVKVPQFNRKFYFLPNLTLLNPLSI